MKLCGFPYFICNYHIKICMKWYLSELIHSLFIHENPCIYTRTWILALLFCQIRSLPYRKQIYDTAYDIFRDITDCLYLPLGFFEHCLHFPWHRYLIFRSPYLLFRVSLCFHLLFLPFSFLFCFLPEQAADAKEQV